MQKLLCLSSSMLVGADKEVAACAKTKKWAEYVYLVFTGGRMLLVNI